MKFQLHQWCQKRWRRVLHRLGFVPIEASSSAIKQLIMANYWKNEKGVIRLTTRDQSEIEIWKRGKGGKWVKVRSDP